MNENELKKEIERHKRFIKKQELIIDALETEITIKDYEIKKLKEGKKRMTRILEKLEQGLDKVIKDLENMNDNKLIKIIDDLEGLKGDIMVNDIVELSGKIGWNEKKENMK